MSAPGKTIGRVGILVMPDMSRFRHTLRTRLKKIQEETEFEIDVEADTTQAKNAIRRLREQLKQFDLSLNVDLDVNAKALNAKVHKETKEAEAKADIDVGVDVDMKRAEARLKTLTRPRTARIRAKIVGLERLSLTLSRVKRKIFGQVDESAKMIAWLIAMIVPAIGQAVISVGALGKSIAMMLRAASVMGPALLSSVGIIGGTVYAAFKGFGDIIKAAGDSEEDFVEAIADLPPNAKAAAWALRAVAVPLKEINQTIKERFFEGFAESLEPLANDLLPQLHDGLAAVASKLGAAQNASLWTIGERLGNEGLNRMLHQLAEGLALSQRGIVGLIGGFLDLSKAGAKYFPKIGDWIGRIGEQFDGWAKQIVTNGDFDRWVEKLISQLAGLRDAIGGAWGILTGFLNGIGSGDDGIENLGRKLKRFSDIVNSSKFQETLSNIFSGASDGAKVMGEALKIVGDNIHAMSDTLGDILRRVGDVTGSLMEKISGVLAEAASGIDNFFIDVNDGLVKMESEGEAGRILGEFADVLGDIIREILILSGAIIERLGPGFRDLLESIKPIIPLLGDNMLSIIDKLMPKLEELLSSGELGEFSEQVAALIENISDLILKLIELSDTPFGKLLDLQISTATGALEVFNSLLEALIELLNLDLPGAFSSGMEAFYRFGETVKDTFSGLTTPLGSLLDFVEDTSGAIQEFFSTAETDSKASVDMMDLHLGLGMSKISGNISYATGGWRDMWGSAWNAMRDRTGVALQGVYAAVNATKSSVSAAMGGLKATLVGMFTGLGGTLYSAGVSMVSGLARGISGAASSAVSAAAEVMARVRAYFPNSPAKKGPFSGRGWVTYSGNAIATDFARGVDEKRNVFASSVANLMTVGDKQVRSLSSVSVTGGGASGGNGRGGPVTVFVQNPWDSDDMIEAVDQRVVTVLNRRG